MNTISAAQVKRRSSELGADLCAIAAIERFQDAPSGFHPRDVLEECNSVIVVALRVPVSTLKASAPTAYTFVLKTLESKLDSITFQIAAELESLGSCAIPIPASEPYDYWDDSRRRGQGILSLKHAAVRAGLGRMGKNTLLVNNQWGNMLCLGAVLTDQKLEADPPADYEACIPDCRICLEACPAKALDATTVDQRKCRGIYGKSSEGGGFIYTCNTCRKICPHYLGIK